jgi:hypothetical protein
MRLLDIDPLTGAVETFHYDHATGASTIKRTENVDAALDRNQRSYNDSSQAWRGEENDMWKVASIPLTTLWEMFQEFNAPRPHADRLQSPFDSDPAWERFLHGKLNSSEYRKLRTAPVRI